MSDLKKAQELRARREMVRQKQQAAIEKRDIKANTTRSENIARIKKAAAKVGKTFSYKDTVTPSVESGPLNYGSPMKKSSCIKMYDSKGKPAGLMAEGSMAYMESIDNRGISQMSPYKMHGDPDTPHTDPELTKKEGKAKTSVSTSGDTTTTTTTQRMSGTGETGGFASGTGYDLDEVIVGLDTDSSSTTNAPRISSTGQEVTTSHPGRYIPYGGGKAGKKSFNKRKDYKAYKQFHETQKEKYFQDPRNWKSTYKN